MRDFKVDPIDEDNVKKLVDSVKTHGFWSGLTGRRVNGTIQIAAGHHRVEAAIQAGEKFAPMFIENDWTDADMVKVYAGENATQRGNTSAALAGSVASAIRYLSKAILTGNRNLLKNFSEGSEYSLGSLQGNLTSEKGLGRDIVVSFLDGTPGINEGSVQQQLANLKASGDYARIVKEIQGEIEEENKEALRQLEKAEREQKIAIEKAAKAEAERKEAAAKAKAAREEADQKRAEYERKHAEEMAKLAEKRAKEAAEEMKKFDALKQTRDAASKAVYASTHEKETDEEGKVIGVKEKEISFDQSVSKHLSNPFQLATFRNLVTQPEIRKILPINQQVTLAKQLVDLLKQQNKESGKDKEMTSKFIEDNIKTMIFKLRTVVRNLDNEEKRQLEQKDWLRKVSNREDEFCGACRRMYSAGMDLLELQKEKPKGVDFPISGEFRKWVKEAQRITNKLASRV